MDPGTSSRLDRRRPVPMGRSAASTPTSSANMRSACRPRAMTFGSFARRRRIRAAGQHSAARSPTASRPIRPTTPTCPTTSSRRRVFGEASYDFGQFKLTAGGRYYDFKEKRDFISGGIFSNGDTSLGDKTKSNGFSPRVIAHLGAEPQPQRQRAGGQGLPPRRHQRSAQRAAVQRPRTRRSSAPFAAPTTTRRCGTTKPASNIRRAAVTFNAAVFHTEIKDLQVTVDAGSCSSRIVVQRAQGAHDGPRGGILGATRCQGSSCRSPAASRGRVRLDGRRCRAGDAAPAFARAIACRPCRSSRWPRPRPTGSASTTDADWYVSASVQHVGNRYHAAGRPGA